MENSSRNWEERDSGGFGIEVRRVITQGASGYRGKATIFAIVDSTMGHRDFGWLFLGRFEKRVRRLVTGIVDFPPQASGILRLGAPRHPPSVAAATFGVAGSEAATANGGKPIRFAGVVATALCRRVGGSR